MTGLIMPKANAFVQAERQPRALRRPVHTFNLRMTPFAIQPFCIAPVLPGETMKNLLLQSRVVTNPVVNPIIGWWLEYYFFYVQHRDLPGSATLQAMMLDAEEDVSSLAPAGTAPKYYNNAGAVGVDYVGPCLNRVVTEYFREEGEAWNDYLVDGLPAAALNTETWLESAIDATSFDDGDDPSAETEMTGLDDSYRKWEYMRAMRLTNMSYEDYLRTFGVRGKAVEDPTKPELLRYVRDWTYPSNTIDPSDGSPTSAVSWAVSERADKDRFFSEPGFVFGVTVVRPKTYYAKQKATLVQFLDRAFDWMPALLRADPYHSIKEYAANAGPLANNVSNGYMIDVRDLFSYGDQFINYNPDTATNGVNAIDLPATNATPTPDVLNKSYPSEAMVDALFVGADCTDGVIQDGIVQFAILGQERDVT